MNFCSKYEMLQEMINDFVDNRPESARFFFHQYLITKFKDCGVKQKVYSILDQKLIYKE